MHQIWKMVRQSIKKSLGGIDFIIYLARTDTMTHAHHQIFSPRFNITSQMKKIELRWAMKLESSSSEIQKESVKNHEVASL